MNATKQTALLYDFCRYLMYVISDYNTLLYQNTIYEDNSVNEIVHYTEDVEYLIQYQQKHGCYPAKFQQLFNEWLLTRM